MTLTAHDVLELLLQPAWFNLGLFLWCASKAIREQSDLQDRYIYLGLGTLLSAWIPLHLPLLALSFGIPYRLDPYIAVLDHPFGDPAYAAAHLLATSHRLYMATRFVYDLFGLGITAVLYVCVRQPNYVSTVKAMILNLIVCLPFYALFPAVGPRYYDASGAFAPYNIPFPMINCVPSVHTSTAILIAYFLWRWKWIRPLLVMYGVVTAFACIGLGVHYFVDLLLAPPYALLVLWLSGERRGWAKAQIHLPATSQLPVPNNYYARGYSPAGRSGEPELQLDALEEAPDNEHVEIS